MSLSNPQKENSRAITDRNKVIGWGKYAREIVQDVLDTDPGYFLWLDANTDVEIASNILAEADENASPNHEFKGWSDRDGVGFPGDLYG